MSEEETRLWAIKKIFDDRDELLLKRLEVRARLAEIKAEDEAIDRKLRDLVAAGRVFGQTIDVIDLHETLKLKIKDRVLEILKQAGPEGTKTALIREHLAMAFGIKTHEKTVGMTLYRLSQENPPLVRRVGRIWFSVPQEPSAHD